MKRFGLLGRTLKHSYSPQIHAELCDEYEYELYEREPHEVEDFVKNSKLDGFNVTIPYKETVMEFCDEISPRALAIGCVNTVTRRTDGSVFGDNTDGEGFATLLKFAKINPENKKVIVLGGGGSSRTVRYICEQLGARCIVIVSRSKENNYDNLHLHKDTDIIINTTPVGMYPNNGIAPVTLADFPNCSGVVDLIYNPSKTALVLEAERLGINAVGGLMMLVAQGREAAEKFCGHEIDKAAEKRTFTRLQTDMRNIVLIGMPGCGKSTIGKYIAKALGRTLVDADKELAKRCGKSIPDILNEDGEEFFRKEETKTLAEICKRSGLVISPGGGCVTIPRNFDIIRQNSIVVFIEREVRLLSKKNRPISQKSDMNELYAKRLPLYEKISDIKIKNNGTLGEATDEILQFIEKHNI